MAQSNNQRSAKFLLGLDVLPRIASLTARSNVGNPVRATTRKRFAVVSMNGFRIECDIAEIASPAMIRELIQKLLNGKSAGSLVLNRAGFAIPCLPFLFMLGVPFLIAFPQGLAIGLAYTRPHSSEVVRVGITSLLLLCQDFFALGVVTLITPSPDQAFIPFIILSAVGAILIWPFVSICLACGEALLAMGFIISSIDRPLALFTAATQAKFLSSILAKFGDGFNGLAGSTNLFGYIGVGQSVQAPILNGLAWLAGALTLAGRCYFTTKGVLCG